MKRLNFILMGMLLLLGVIACTEGGSGEQSFFGLDDFDRGEIIEDAPDGKPLIRAYLEDYLLSGEMKVWYKNGQLQIQQSFVDGYCVSDYQTWYSNGNIRFRGNRDEGRIRTWHLNGVLSYVSDTLSKAGAPVAMEWNDKGELISMKRKSEDGVVAQKLYYPGEILGAEGNIKSGTKIGKWRYYRSDGLPLRELDHDTEDGKMFALPKMGLDGLVDGMEQGLESFSLSPEPLNMETIQSKIGYPMIAQDSEIEGQVLCRVFVERAGEVVNYQIISSPHPILANAVAAHILQLRFEPLAAKDTYKIYQVSIPFNFSLMD